eukprot:5588526-Lingulodinium_polyedra.AAC.1
MADKPNWKQLSELPKLDIPTGEAWERNLALTTWVKKSRPCLYHSVRTVLRLCLQNDEGCR